MLERVSRRWRHRQSKSLTFLYNRLNVSSHERFQQSLSNIVLQVHPIHKLAALFFL